MDGLKSGILSCTFLEMQVYSIYSAPNERTKYIDVTQRHIYSARRHFYPKTKSFCTQAQSESMTRSVSVAATLYISFGGSGVEGPYCVFFCAELCEKNYAPGLEFF